MDLYEIVEFVCNININYMQFKSFVRSVFCFSLVFVGLAILFICLLKLFAMFRWHKDIVFILKLIA